MKTMAGQLIAALVLLAAGEAFRRAAHIEQRLAVAEEDLATLAPAAADAEYDEVESSMALVRGLPFVGESLMADVRQARAVAAYWRADYAALPSEEADLASNDTNPDLIFLAANATYRKVVGQRTGQAGARDLDGVLRMYTMLLKRDPASVDGSYNYEYVVRLRNIVARSQPKGGGGGLKPAEPAPPSVHGDEGSPPVETEQSDQFRVIVPLRPEERSDQLKAGVGGSRSRKG